METPGGGSKYAKWGSFRKPSHLKWNSYRISVWILENVYVVKHSLARRLEANWSDFCTVVSIISSEMQVVIWPISQHWLVSVFKRKCNHRRVQFCIGSFISRIPITGKTLWNLEKSNLILLSGPCDSLMSWFKTHQNWRVNILCSPNHHHLLWTPF